MGAIATGVAMPEPIFLAGAEFLVGSDSVSNFLE